MAAAGAFRALLALMLLSLTIGQTPTTPQQLQDYRALASGVGKFQGSEQTGSRLLAFGTTAFVLALDGTSVSVAAARFGAGRLVHFGHEAFLGYPAAANSGAGRLLQNSLRWASGGKATAIRIAGTNQWGAELAAAVAKVKAGAPDDSALYVSVETKPPS